MSLYLYFYILTCLLKDFKRLYITSGLISRFSIVKYNLHLNYITKPFHAQKLKCLALCWRAKNKGVKGGHFEVICGLFLAILCIN